MVTCWFSIEAGLEGTCVWVISYLDFLCVIHNEITLLLIWEFGHQQLNPQKIIIGESREVIRKIESKSNRIVLFFIYECKLNHEIFHMVSFVGNIGLTLRLVHMMQFFLNSTAFFTCDFVKFFTWMWFAIYIYWNHTSQSHRIGMKPIPCATS